METIMAKDNNTYPAACNVSGGSLPDGYKIMLHLEIGFDGVSPDQERGWAVSNRVIAYQRGARNLTTKELEDLAQTTIKINALQCGMKVVSKEETIAKIKAAFSGMDEETQRETLESLKI